MKRHTRAAVYAATNQTTKVVDGLLLITMTAIEIQKTATEINSIDFKDLTVTAVSANKSTDGKTWAVVEVDISGTGVAIKLELMQAGGNWRLSKITHDSKPYPLIDAGASFGLSYACTNLTIFHYNNPDVLRFVGFQIQPNFVEGQKVPYYGLDNNCTGFFSAAIWGGIFVVLLLGIIMMIGITFIMDINTMDKFDDPKGKTITISATD